MKVFETLLAVLIVLVLLALIGIIPALIIWAIWNNVVTAIWTNLPSLGFWSVYLILWALEIVGKAFTPKVNVKKD
jgi:hypothetical protein